MNMKQACRQAYEPVINEIETLISTNQSPIIVTIDGMSASGKTTLGHYIQSLFECNLFHMDDFFLQGHQRTEERLKEIGGNVDYERFNESVLLPLLAKQTVTYRPYDCSNASISQGSAIAFKQLNIIEGSYSHHPYFGEQYTQLKVFLCISKQEQIRRISIRNGEEKLKRFISEWIPKENAYHEMFGIKEKAMIVKL